MMGVSKIPLIKNRKYLGLVVTKAIVELVL